jgi:hypothetical protein
MNEEFFIVLCYKRSFVTIYASQILFIITTLADNLLQIVGNQ